MKALTVDDARRKTTKDLAPAALITTLCVCRDRLHFGKEKLQKFVVKFTELIDAITEGYIEFQDLKDSLEKDDGVILPYDYTSVFRVNSTKETRQTTEYIFVANTIAAMCTVFCDKFGMKSVKVTQAIKQYTTIFNELKNDDFMVNQLRDEFYRDYKILIK